MATILSVNATNLERNYEEAVNNRISNLPVRLKHNRNPELCAANLLDYLAKDLSVDYWVDSWDEAKKRAVITASYEVHSYKGTPHSVKTALKAINAEIEITEWYQQNPKLQANTIEVAITAREGLDSGVIADVHNIIKRTKPTHVTYGVILKKASVHNLGFACAAKYRQRIIASGSIQ